MVATTVVSAGAGGGFVIDAGAKILAQDVSPFIAGPRRDRRLPRCGHPAAQRSPRRRRPAGGRGPTGGRHGRLGRAESRLSGGQPRRHVRRGAGRARGRHVARGRARQERLRPSPPTRSWATPAASRIAARRATGMAPSRRTSGRSPCSRPRSTAGPPRAGPPSRMRSTPSPSWARISCRVARLGQPGDVGRGRRQRPDARRERPGSVVVRDAKADRRRAAGERRRATRHPGAAGRRRSARPASTRRRAPWRPAPSRRSIAAWAASSSSSMIPLSGGRRFTWNRRSMPPAASRATAMP